MSRQDRSHDTTTRVVLKTVAAYEEAADEFFSRWGKRRYRQPPLLRRLLALLPSRARLLDLGCGGGQDTRQLWRLGYRVTGLDRAGALLTFARQRSAAISLVQADMRWLPLQRECVDGIWAAASMIHLPKGEVRGVLADLFTIIRPGGVLAATVTQGTKSRTLSRGWIPGRYVARWKKAELEQAFRAAGWCVIELNVVIGQERKGRWINVIARRG